MSLSNESDSTTEYSYGPPTQAGQIPFTPPGTDRKCETAYWLWGDLTSSIPPLIVLHGGPGAPGRDLRALTALYSRHHIPVLLYDQIGCGASTHLRDTRGDSTFWNMELFLAELDNVRKHLNIDTFDLFGHSCGGMIAVSCALTQPRGLRKLIVASSSPSEALRQQGHKRARAELPREVRETLVRCEREGQCDTPEYGEAMMVLMRRILCRMDPWPPGVQECMKLMQEDDTVCYSLYGPVPIEPTGPWGKYDVVSRLPEITETTAPGGVLLTHGRYDMNQDEEMAPFFTQIRARVKWVRFAESSHMAHLEEAEAYLNALAHFLKMA